MTAAAPFVVLDDAGTDGGRGYFFRNPASIIAANAPEEVETAISALQAAIEKGQYVAGYFSYELGYCLEPKLLVHLPQERGAPLLWFGVFEKPDETVPREFLDGAGRGYAGALQMEWDEAAYSRRFGKAHEWIAAGDIYQANLSQRARFSFMGDAKTLYARLRTQSRGNYCAFIDDGERQFLSFSPEKFFDIREGVMTTRPMKGTAPRHADKAKDDAAKHALRQNPKDRAENLMIVDLLRNDVGRLARTGSVRVDNLFEVETYPTVHQMVSTVSGDVGPIAIRDILHALFPCGSVTGTPKIRAMEIIRELETSPRGIYCGAIGAFGPDGFATFNVAIRTLTIENNRGELGIGSAVVYDSKPSEEFEECALKARYYNAGRPALELIETLRFSPQEGFVRLERHLARMRASAAAFGFPFQEEQALEKLHSCAKDPEMAMRMRLTLDEDGSFACTAAPLGVIAKEWRYAISPVVMQSNDILLQHKTSWRDVYETEHARLSRETGSDEVLFFNERGELTEGARSNVFIQICGKLYTPPLSCGVLNGCLRQEMIENGESFERVLTRTDLAQTKNVFFGNSLRGLIQAARVSDAKAAA